MSALEKHPFKRRYLLMSGGEVRDEQERIERQILLNYETILKLYEICQEYQVMVHFCGDESDYAVGNDEEIQNYSVFKAFIFSDDTEMLAMPIGAAVAMGNAHEKLKKICPYCTKTNVEHGVAYAIEKVLEGRLEDLRNPEYEP